MVDVPVSQRNAEPYGRTLTFMVGSSDAASVMAQAVLEPMTMAVLEAGATGSGQVGNVHQKCCGPA